MFVYYFKVRQRSPESRGDRYMLLTFEDPPNNIKVLIKFINKIRASLNCMPVVDDIFLNSCRLVGRKI